MSKWIIDADHSVASFSVRHLLVADVHGQFNKISGSVEFDPADPAGSSFNLEIWTESITTGIQKRNDHLKSADFFDVEKFPAIRFKSTGTDRTRFNSLKINGDLTIRNITRPVTIETEFSGPVKSPFGETTIGFSGKIVINREDYGITWNEPLEKGGFMVGKDIQISVDLEGDLVS